MQILPQIYGGYMLKLIRSLEELDAAQLLAVYEQSNRENMLLHYSHESENMQVLLAQQEFYSDLVENFKNHGCIYASWAPDGFYRSAVRLERYTDGFLLTGLETASEVRGKGYATDLIRSVLKRAKEIGANKFYSHISQKNYASIAVHLKCGFIKILDYAVFLDGSVNQDCATYIYEIDNTRLQK